MHNFRATAAGLEDLEDLAACQCDAHGTEWANMVDAWGSGFRGFQRLSDMHASSALGAEMLKGIKVPQYKGALLLQAEANLRHFGSSVRECLLQACVHEGWAFERSVASVIV